MDHWNWEYWEGAWGVTNHGEEFPLVRCSCLKFSDAYCTDCHAGWCWTHVPETKCPYCARVWPPESLQKIKEGRGTA